MCFMGPNRLPKEFSNANCDKKFLPLIIRLLSVYLKLLWTEIRHGLKFFGSWQTLSQSKDSHQILEPEFVFHLLKSPSLDPTQAQLNKLLMSTCRCGFIYVSVHAKLLVSFRLTAYLTVSINHFPHVCLMLSWTNPLSFAYPTVAQLITFSSTRSFPFKCSVCRVSLV
jgi:hypothetical protein